MFADFCWCLVLGVVAFLCKKNIYSLVFSLSKEQTSDLANKFHSNEFLNIGMEIFSQANLLTLKPTVIFLLTFHVL